jgi:CheY-like chemotaxis protein
MDPESTAGKALHCSRVLLAEDDRALLELLTEYLELQGLEVSAVEDGEAAMRELEGARPPDVALLDVRMPGIWGTDVLRRIKRDPRLSRIKVAVLTGLSPEELDLETRPDEFLAKPVDVDSLRAALARMCA